MSSAAKNPHNFAWSHDGGNQFLVVGEAKVHIEWQMQEVALRAALAALDLVEDMIEAAVAFVRDYRIDIDTRLQA